MAIGDMKTLQDIKNLNDYLSERSYIEGWQPSQADVAVFESLETVPAIGNVHVLRWYNHIKSYDHKHLPGEKSLTVFQDHTITIDSVTQVDDDIDLFGSDDEEDVEAIKIREERLKAYSEKKSKKPALIAKSNILIDVKPWDDQTNMDDIEKSVRSIKMNGLVWGVSKLVPIGYGIKKLQIICVVEDEKVSVDELLEQIEDFDLVQSTDIAAFNKI
ncbi:PREDICTED: elongation factor 1-beta' [Ceratosolen solmsi marchali]|uniref:Elongation factor 1-beta' n=1 Tax=Ceratosolen solmsi marchali TaxID=326594 RepID=A0AAJ7DT84_9HYME|nr:PREDICTED: elongation factor 1-beta' [Ceratosolen solmsi marchali]